MRAKVFFAHKSLAPPVSPSIKLQFAKYDCDIKHQKYENKKLDLDMEIQKFPILDKFLDSFGFFH